MILSHLRYNPLYKIRDELVMSQGDCSSIEATYSINTFIYIQRIRSELVTSHTSTIQLKPFIVFTFGKIRIVWITPRQ